jgi:hypothetical protein
MVMNGKNLVEGFDMEYGRMNAMLGSTPSPLAPTVGAGPVVGMARYIDPPTEILNAGETVLWRISHIGVDSHAIHFHLFNVQVVNRVDWTNTIKPPYDDEIGWKETIRTNPFEDIIVAIRPVTMTLPFQIPQSNRLLDPTMPAGATGNFQPVAPPIGLPAVAQTTNVMTNFGWEYVWHCHLLGHEENDMMRPIVFVVPPPAAPTNVVATLASNTSATVTFVAPPVVPGGSPILSYTATAFIGGTATNRTGTLLGAVAGPITITGLTQGTTYTFRVTAANATGTGPAGISNSLTMPTVPGAPTIGTATAGNAQATVAFTAPASNGGSPILSYKATAFIGGVATALTGTLQGAVASPITVTGLTNGTTYTFRVTATNALGTSAFSNFSNGVTPSSTLPAAPATPTNFTFNTAVTSTTTARVQLTWGSDGVNVGGFTVQRSSNPTFPTASNYVFGPTVRQQTQTGLPRGVTYYYRMRATNGTVSSPWTATLTVVTP